MGRFTVVISYLFEHIEADDEDSAIEVADSYLNYAFPEWEDLDVIYSAELETS